MVEQRLYFADGQLGGLFQCLLLPPNKAHRTNQSDYGDRRGDLNQSASAGSAQASQQALDVFARAVQALNGFVGFDRFRAVALRLIVRRQLQQRCDGTFNILGFLPGARFAHQDLRLHRIGAARVVDDLERGWHQVAVDQRIEQVDGALLQLRRIWWRVRDQDRAQEAERARVVGN